MEMSKILINLRLEKGLNQKDLADALHISSSAISKYEIGRSLPEYDTLLKLADFFHVNLDYLFGRTEIKTAVEDLESKLKTRSGMVPIDSIFQLNDTDKEVVGLLLHSYMVKEEYRK